MKTGIVMEIDGNFLTVLTPEGEFLRTKKLNQVYTLGEEITFFPFETDNRTSFFKQLRMISHKPVWIVAIAFVVFIFSLLSFYQNDKAYAYMSIDVNPSIELGVNKKMQVIELTGYNQTGKKVISKLTNWKKQDVVDVTKRIVTEMKRAGLLERNKHVIFSTVRTEETEKAAEKKLKQNLGEIKDLMSAQHLDLTVVAGTKQTLNKAHKQGLTAGKYQAAKRQLKKESLPANGSNNIEKVTPKHNSQNKSKTPGTKRNGTKESKKLTPLVTEKKQKVQKLNDTGKPLKNKNRVQQQTQIHVQPKKPTSQKQGAKKQVKTNPTPNKQKNKPQSKNNRNAKENRLQHKAKKQPNQAKQNGKSPSQAKSKGKKSFAKGKPQQEPKRNDNRARQNNSKHSDKN
ncbi:anti-sigma factor domain-containing protein [Bacillus rubiinfantis]|uniref:anti-sigma factor domain-containing protein n=1 Tax=Bacillus rubiinfantis TaxID=1499680 RepID=UPI0005A9D945|nr:anti-sigma factor domain-containing protein [Bacillus rubiinfantis]